MQLPVFVYVSVCRGAQVQIVAKLRPYLGQLGKKAVLNTCLSHPKDVGLTAEVQGRSAHLEKLPATLTPHLQLVERFLSFLFCLAAVFDKGYTLSHYDIILHMPCSCCPLPKLQARDLPQAACSDLLMLHAPQDRGMLKFCACAFCLVRRLQRAGAMLIFSVLLHFQHMSPFLVFVLKDIAT